MKTILLRAFSFLVFLSVLPSAGRAADTNPPPRLSVELRDGSRVVGDSVEKKIEFRSALLGEIKLAVKEIRSVECVATNAAKLTTANGDTLTGWFVNSKLAVKTSFGKVEVPMDSIRSVKVASKSQFVSSSQTFNIDFGPGKGNTKQVGPAAVGNDGDFWNSVDTGNNDHTESGLKFANGQPSPIEVESVNLSGGWGNDGKMGVRAPMLDSFSYPVNNQGGDAKVILYHVPAGTYSLYLYGHTLYHTQNGDYEVSVAGRNYGRKQTSSGSDAVLNTDWVEGSQYVRFPAVDVAEGENLEILIHPGNRTIVNGGRSVADAMICGLQLVK